MLKTTLKRMVVLTVGLLVLLVAQAGFTENGTPPPASNTISAGEASVFKTQKERQSYAIGADMERNFKRQGFDLDIDMVLRGMKDAQAGDKLVLTETELLETLNVFASDLRRRQAKDKLIAAQDNKKEAEAFLTDNETKEGVVVLPSGLQYKILKAGNGRKPTAQDTVEVHYKGSLINGTLFLNTYDTGQPATIKVSDPQVIAGVREALKLMPVGSTWRLFIPSKLAYLNMGRPPYIGPNATLIYEVELLAIK